MRFPGGGELPPEQREAWQKALRLEWISLGYWLSAVVLLYFTLGQSQAMKAAWIEDILSLFPPIAFLVAARYRTREPNAKFGWGYHRAITVAYVVATLALFALGVFILVDSTERLLRGTHPPIGLVEVLGVQVWLGWLMLAALVYSFLPALVLGWMKRPLAAKLHDKVLFADAKMNQADWMTALAAMLGIVGIGFGLWWADAVAAIVIGLDIVHDGQRFLRESVGDLMDQSPQTHDERRPHPLVDRIRDEVRSLPWVDQAAVRMREHGHQITGDIWVVPREGTDVVERVEELTERVNAIDWRVEGVGVSVATRLEEVPEGVAVDGRGAGARPEPPS